MVWPVAALAVLVFVFVFAYGSVLEARLSAFDARSDSRLDEEPSRGVR